MKSRRRVSRSALRAWQPALESLEERTLLTGNVVASVLAGGNLLVRGDSSGNQVGIQSTGGGALSISSLDGTTTINGTSGPFVTSAVTGNVFVFLGAGDDVLKVGGASPTTVLPHNLLIGLGNGSDTVNVAQTSIGGNLDIFGGRGGDTITVGSAASASAISVGGNLFIDAGCGDSTVAVFDASITGNLTIIGNGQNDHIQVGYDAGLGLIGDEGTTGHVDVGGNLTISDIGGCDPLLLDGFCDFFSCLGGDPKLAASCGLSESLAFAGKGGLITGGLLSSCLPTFCNFFGCGLSGSCHTMSAGGEHVAVADVTVGGNLKIQTGCGNDEILIGAAHTPATDNNPLINLVFGPVSVGGNVDVKSGAGNDTILLVEVSVTGNTSLDGGCGNDNIGVLDSSTFTGDFTIRAGGGIDSIVLATDTFSGNVTIHGGRGTDTIGLADSLFQQSVTINGGPGNDTFLETGPPFSNDFAGGAPTLNSVESVSTVDATTFAAAFPWISGLLGI